MAKQSLVIVESPAKAKTIEKYLGQDFRVKASMGHLRDLPKSTLGVDVENGFAPYYVVNDNKRKTVAELKRALKNADELWLATDEDREGEAIAWHLLEVLKPKVPVRRMVFHEITKEAIAEAKDVPALRMVFAKDKEKFSTNPELQAAFKDRKAQLDKEGN